MTVYDQPEYLVVALSRGSTEQPDFVISIRCHREKTAVAVANFLENSSALRGVVTRVFFDRPATGVGE